MAQKKAHEVGQFLKTAHKETPILLIYGPDRGLVAEYGQILRAQIGVKQDDPFAFVSLESSQIDSDPSLLIDEANTLSLFGGHRLIVVKNGANQKGLLASLRQILSSPPQDSFIIIEAGDLKKTAPLRRLIEEAKNAMALPAYNDDAKSLDKVISEVLSAHQLTIAPDARLALSQLLGGDRLATRAELEKLCLYVYPHKTVRLEDVSQMIANVSHINQDDIVDAILMGQLAVAETLYERQVSAGVQPFLVLNAAQRQFQQLLLLRYQLQESRQSASQIVRQAKPPIFYKRQAIMERALCLWRLDKISWAMQRLEQAVLETRQMAALQKSLCRQALLAIALEAQKAARQK